MATLSAAESRQVAELTGKYVSTQRREAVRIAAIIALAYQARVDPDDPAMVEEWLNAAVARLIRGSDQGAVRAATYFDTIRSIEAGAADGFRSEPSLGVVNAGVRRSLLYVGPVDYKNRIAELESLDLPDVQLKAARAEAKAASVRKIVAASTRHVQAGSRTTILDNTARDTRVLGWVRVTRPAPCWFCAMLASRGIVYKGGSFDESDPRFIGPGTAKVHDSCGCGIKPVYTRDDPLVERTEEFAAMWQRWGAGGGDAAIRFRRAYNHFRSTGDYLTWDEANDGLNTSRTNRPR